MLLPLRRFELNLSRLTAEELQTCLRLSGSKEIQEFLEYSFA